MTKGNKIGLLIVIGVFVVLAVMLYVGLSKRKPVVNTLKDNPWVNKPRGLP